MFSIIQAAGWPIWPLIACSVLALAIVIDRFISLKASKIAPAKLLDEVLSVTRTAIPGPDVVTQLEKVRPSVKCWPVACVQSTPTHAAPKTTCVPTWKVPAALSPSDWNSA